MWTSNFWRILFCVLFTISSLAVTISGRIPIEEKKAESKTTQVMMALDIGTKNSIKRAETDTYGLPMKKFKMRGGEEEDVPSEKKCRPYVEKALKELGEVASAELSAESVEIGSGEHDGESIEVIDESYAGNEDDDSKEDTGDSKEDTDDSKEDADDSKEDNDSVTHEENDDENDTQEVDDDSKEDDDARQENDDETQEDDDNTQEDDDNSKEDDTAEDDGDSKEETDAEEGQDEDSQEGDDGDSKENDEDDTNEDDTAEQDDNNDSAENESNEDGTESAEIKKKHITITARMGQSLGTDDNKEHSEDIDENAIHIGRHHDAKKDDDDADDTKEDDDDATSVEDNDDGDSKELDVAGKLFSEDLLKVVKKPKNLRSRDHIAEILRLDEDSDDEKEVEKAADIVLRDIKKIYENSIKPLEVLYKYRDLSNRHFGDPEIFSKPLVLFMGPWSGGKSSIGNYLTGLEFTKWALRTGAEPSPAYFNILMHGEKPEVLDGTRLAADWTFAGLQKFGQGLEERLRGLKYPSKLLEKVNIVEIPGILEVRKQVSRIFPFNDACQWFIDRADIIFLIYDPSKLDVGPETEAILDQLKGRESQTRIILNKADTVKPEELMRVQSALIWNISPLMSSAQPPIMYTVSLWSMPFEKGAPARLLLAQEKELLRDLRRAIDTRIENKIASARRFAVRVRNHAKMVDCYLTTYYNHKTIFGNKKLIAEAIIENPQNYHIYEGLSTLTNISRYDLPDPETYRDFFRLNNLYDFQQLQATCTYFRGCPINRLDVAIAYDLPELAGKYKRMIENSAPQEGMPQT